MENHPQKGAPPSPDLNLIHVDGNKGSEILVMVAIIIGVSLSKPHIDELVVTFPNIYISYVML